MSVKHLLAAVWAAPLVVLGAAAVCLAGGVNQCLDCHSTPARLVPAVREIQRCCEGLPWGGKSEGEG